MLTYNTFYYFVKLRRVVSFERQELLPETLGITLKESKTMTAAMQQTMITKQVEEYTSKHKTCLYCGKRKSIKGYHIQ